ncbi:Uroporphyrinogen decarboxylase [Rubrivivax sp. A210]|uniref:uroporphyrinogen decarboxylase family protein n=1 Tax=Rubrivivax sp. A210 TaxID=2772301 RepID=UPI001919FE9D|nr:uroporphyrinogen decarboxylase family protein [Rubrivivax sp. A210]CAD5375085.1 Uroporphyrinogen decarboxylase [Rubrivivax sp. A210]
MSAERMNSMQRTLAALSHREGDRVPLFLLTTLHGARELGMSIEDYFSRAEHVVEGQLRLLHKYGSDCLYPFYYAALETEAWGGSTIFLPDGPPLCGAPVIRRPEDIDKLQAPDIASAPGLQRALATLRALAAEVAGTVPLIGVAISPFSLPVMQMGFGAYLDLMMTQPERFECLMRVNEEFTVAWANAQLAAGATAICYFDPVSSSTNITRAQYLATGQQVARRTLARIQGPTATHLASGRCATILDDIAQTGTAAIGVSALEDLGALKAQAAGRVALLGNLNGIEMRRWTPRRTEYEVKKAIAGAARGGGFILADNHGEIPWQVPDWVLIGIREAVELWGRYPLDWVERWRAEPPLEPG